MTLAATIDQLRELARSCNDASGYFAAMYSRVTAEIARTVDSAGFASGTQMESFAIGFAQRYTHASANEVGRPRCWQACRDIAHDDRLLIVQHLLLGINAHVNYDLPQAVVEVARAAGGLEFVRHDFDAVNAVLAATSVSVVRELDRVSRWVSDLASVGGGRLFNFSLRVARDQAWAAAERLYPLDDDQTRAYVAELDRLVSVLAYLIAHPGLPARLAARALRRVEEHEARKVIAILLGDPPTLPR